MCVTGLKCAEQVITFPERDDETEYQINMCCLGTCLRRHTGVFIYSLVCDLEFVTLHLTVLLNSKISVFMQR